MTDGDRKVRATAGRESQAKDVYKDIYEIIMKNKPKNVTLKCVMQTIASITPGAFYNYFSETSKQQGQVSLRTVKRFSEFFDLPINVFDCSAEFTEVHRDKMAQKIRETFGDLPAEPKKKRHGLREIAVEEFIEMTKDISIPWFQRNFVWNASLQSDYVRTLLYFGMGISPIYLHEEATGKYIIVDGRQRLETIQRFLENKFALSKKTEPIGEISIAGKRYSELPEELQNKLTRAKLMIIVFSDYSSDELRDFFEMQNTGRNYKK